MAAREGASKVAGSPIKGAALSLAKSAGRYALSKFGDRVQKTTTRLTDYVQGGGDVQGLVGAVTGSSGKTGKLKAFAQTAWGGLKRKFGLGGKGETGKFKFYNIIESQDIGAPVSLVYNQWTQFADWPSFMKKVEKVVQESDEKITFQAKVFWSRRTWQATIQEQSPDEKIIWNSQGAKGSADGSVTFHELAPQMTRVLVSMVWTPKGFMEKTGGIWRAQGRRARLEFKHFRRQVMNDALQHPDDIEGWRGVIHEGEVVKDHETAVREEREAKEREEQEREDREAEERAERGEQEPEEGEEFEGEEPEEPEEGEEPEETEETGEPAGRRGRGGRREEGEERRPRGRGRRAVPEEPEEAEEPEYYEEAENYEEPAEPRRGTRREPPARGPRRR
ncbi:hypothetical protein GCM10009677_49360 [Sphaerisporangium rubeum]|uniref:Putative membrane protein n=1 Tax=Sphaerisporangium rubeum TaxID=321317 RepID=A0A7X0IE74_9ACTN|nr:SRPBCC family protein [Sphaerisporangium rubeum]MBB6473580.1 putative membrane protein [Sphaerisporangium rubeum]